MSIERESDPPSFWDDLCLENTTYIPTVLKDDRQQHLDDDWVTEVERLTKLRDLARREEISNQLTSSNIASGQITVPTPVDASIATNSSSSVPPVSVPPVTIGVASDLPNLPAIANDPYVSAPAATAPPLASPLRRSQLSIKGTFGTTKFFETVFLSHLDQSKNHDSHTQQLAYLVSLYTCNDTGLENIFDPRMNAAKSKKDDPDSPTFHQAMNGPDAAEYIKAMQLAVATLV